ncbi:MAG: aminotransferase class III-fold pyridoxal phosphate-dependent enzyme [Anaerolineaceae bacterium]|nr:aminotransferase class III-fold pyridoxal phosphate-dependent enzyme [Anaerolineaceae bacterium]
MKELRSRPGVEIVFIDDRKLIFDLRERPEIDVVLERCINHSRAMHALRLFEGVGVPCVNRYEVARRCGDKILTAAALEVLRRISQPAFLAQVRDVGEYLVERLEEINSPLIRDVRGRGLIVGIELECPSAALVSAGYEKGLLLLNAGEQVLRFVPPLIAQRADIDSLIPSLTGMLEDQSDA